MAATRTRIFSDLHFGDARSTLQDLALFTPLLGDADRVILNGDTIDTQIPHLRRHRDPMLEFFATAGPEVTFLTGNHDPDLSDHAELELLDGRVWLTHGDVFFDTVAPWSHHGPEIALRLNTLASGLTSEERGRIETRLRLNRAACTALPEPEHYFHDDFFAQTKRMARTLFPPTRVIEMLKAWRELPRLSADLARALRPRARVVISGHSHYPGVWRVKGEAGAPRITVINTGSFTRPFGSLFVDIEGERIRVRRIESDGSTFRIGGVVADFSVAD